MDLVGDVSADEMDPGQDVSADKMDLVGDVSADEIDPGQDMSADEVDLVGDESADEIDPGQDVSADEVDLEGDVSADEVDPGQRRQPSCVQQRAAATCRRDGDHHGGVGWSQPGAHVPCVLQVGGGGEGLPGPADQAEAGEREGRCLR